MILEVVKPAPRCPSSSDQETPSPCPLGRTCMWPLSQGGQGGAVPSAFSSVRVLTPVLFITPYSEGRLCPSIAHVAVSRVCPALSEAHPLLQNFPRRRSEGKGGRGRVCL